MRPEMTFPRDLFTNTPFKKPAMSEIVSLAHQACREHRVLRITYFSQAKERTERAIDVYWVNDQHIDAVCRLRKDFRHFRIDRIVSAELLLETFNRNPEFAAVLKYCGLVMPPNAKFPLTGAGHADSTP